MDKDTDLKKALEAGIHSNALLSAGRDLLTVDGLAKEMADHIGHGMREKCIKHAEVARAFIIAMLDSEAIVRIHILRNWPQDKIDRFAKHLLGDKCQKCESR